MKQRYFVSTRNKDRKDRINFTIDTANHTLGAVIERITLENYIPNIDRYANVLVFYDSLGVKHEITIPEGNYSICRLKTSLETLLNSAETGGNTYTVTIDKDFKLLVTATGGGLYSIDGTDGAHTAQRVTGFTINNASTTTILANQPVNLALGNIHIRSNELTDNNATNFLNNELAGNLYMWFPVTVPYGATQVVDQVSGTSVIAFGRDNVFEKLDISLYRDNGKPLINTGDFSLMIVS